MRSLHWGPDDKKGGVSIMIKIAKATALKRHPTLVVHNR